MKISWKKGIAELVGTFVLTFFGCGVAVFSSHLASDYGSFLACTSLAFGLTIVAMAYSIGNVSGCHINPAVTLAMLINKKISLVDAIVYWVSQILGACVAAALLLLITMNSGFASCALGSNTVNTTILGTGFGGLALGFLAEVVLTFVFVLVILGVTSKKEYSGVAGLVIGLTLTLVHLLGISLTGTSVNPARSIGPALFAMFNGVYEPIQQIWIFILAPLVGAAIAALVFRFIAQAKEEKAEEASSK